MFAYLEGSIGGKELEEQIKRYKRYIPHIGGKVQLTNHIIINA